MIEFVPDKPRKAGRPYALKVPTLSELNLSEQDRNKQADSLRTDAYKISKLLHRNVLEAIRSKSKQSMKDLVIPWAIATDKVLQGVESSGLDLHVPAALMDKFALAINLKAAVPLPVDKPQLP